MKLVFSLFDNKYNKNNKKFKKTVFFQVEILFNAKCSFENKKSDFCRFFEGDL